MASISLTGIKGRGNHFIPLRGALVLSLSYGKVGGRLFLCDGTPLPGHGTQRWQGREPAQYPAIYLQPEGQGMCAARAKGILFCTTGGRK